MKNLLQILERNFLTCWDVMIDLYSAVTVPLGVILPLAGSDLSSKTQQRLVQLCTACFGLKAGESVTVAGLANIFSVLPER